MRIISSNLHDVTNGFKDKAYHASLFPDIGDASMTSVRSLFSPRIMAIQLLILASFAPVILAAGTPATQTPQYKELCARLGLKAGFEKGLAATPLASAGKSPMFKNVEAGHLGGGRYLFRITLAKPIRFQTHSIYLYWDMDNDSSTGRANAGPGGADIIYSIKSKNLTKKVVSHNKAYPKKKAKVGVARWNSELYIAVDTTPPSGKGPIKIPFTAMMLIPNDKRQNIRRITLTMPRSSATPKPLPRQRIGTVRLHSDYLYADTKVLIAGLSDKGLTGEEIHMPKEINPKRELPKPVYETRSRTRTRSPMPLTRIPISVKEEQGVARSAARISFGFPLPKGQLYAPSSVRLLDENGKAIPAQVTATSHWPGNSLRWVLIDAAVPLKANEEKALTVECGARVRTASAMSPLTCTRNGDGLTIVTGPMMAVVGGGKFNFVNAIWRDANGDGRFDPKERVDVAFNDGVKLVDENGKVFTTAAGKPESMRVEQSGPEKLVIRAEGRYVAKDGNRFMRYVTRLVFHRGASTIKVVHQHINNNIDREFSDITSLTIPVTALAGKSSAYLYDGKGLKAQRGVNVSFFQADERSSVVKAGNAQAELGKGAGVLIRNNGKAQSGVVIHEFWQRWPKGFVASQKGYSVDLLPKLPSKSYGRNLPYWLQYPFIEGKHRSKWGMAFTTRMTFHFGDNLNAAEMEAEANMPVVAVVPAEWYAKTGALVPLAVPKGKQFAEYDAFINESYGFHLRRRDEDRAYGYLNYGDWFRERGRNWGNNEYDLGHGLLVQFARTGNRDLFRLGLTAERHHANSDIIHAYPDPYYIGSNPQHSFGHTGVHSQYPTHSEWSHLHDSHTSANNGHTWADGMADAWCMSGDAVIMDSTLKLGEHIVWGMSRDFEMSLGWPRSAGWALRAIMAIYRIKPDPLYLEAAKRIADEPITKQSEEGLWHPEWRSYVSNFQMGLMMGAMASYHQGSGDPRALESLRKATDFMMKSYNVKSGGWPGGITPEYKSYKGRSAAGPHFNPIIINGMAYYARVTNDAKMAAVCEEALTIFGFFGIRDAFGKSFAMRMQGIEGLGHLQAWAGEHRKDKGLLIGSGDYRGMERLFLNASDAEVGVMRRPFTKVFWVRADKADAKLTINRRVTGKTAQKPKPSRLRVMTKAGKVVGEDKFGAFGKHAYSCDLKGPKGAIYKVEIEDGTHGGWSMSGDVSAVMKVVPRGTIRRKETKRYYFSVPDGTKDFTIKIVGCHQAPYGIIALDPTGKIAAMHRGMNPGMALLKPEDLKPKKGAMTIGAFGQINVKPDAKSTGQIWTLLLWGGGDLSLEMIGVPPYLAAKKEHWFKP
jgi:PcRGLX-like protein central beta sandwich domain/PcRGLX-like N-terminal RIFT barrel domain